MMRSFFFPAIAAALLALAAQQDAGPPAQSVAEAARAARERQKSSNPKHLLTDDDIASRHAGDDSAALTGNEAEVRAQLEDSVPRSLTVVELKTQLDAIIADANRPAVALIAKFKQTALYGYEDVDFPSRQEWEDQLDSATTRFLAQSAAAASQLQSLLDQNRDALSRQDGPTLQKLRAQWIDALVPYVSWQMRAQQLVVEGQARAKAYMADSAAAWRDYRRGHVKQAESTVATTLLALREQEIAFQKDHAHYTCEIADFTSSESTPTNPANPQTAWSTGMDALHKLGYSITLQGCDAEHFTVVAVPPATDGTQGHAFCTSETAGLRIAADGRPDNCLAAGREWHAQ